MERDSATSGQHAESQGGGFSHVPESLAQVGKLLRSGSEELREAESVAPQQSPDAGQSSEILSQALADLFLGSLGLGQELSNLSDRVDDTKGSYGDIENDAEGAMKAEISKGMEPYSDLSSRNMPL